MNRVIEVTGQREPDAYDAGRTEVGQDLILEFKMFVKKSEVDELSKLADVNGRFKVELKGWNE